MRLVPGYLFFELMSCHNRADLLATDYRLVELVHLQPGEQPRYLAHMKLPVLLFGHSAQELWFLGTVVLGYLVEYCIRELSYLRVDRLVS